MGDEDKNKDGKALIKSLTKLIECTNKEEFKYPFTGCNHDTLPWIFEVEKYFRINRYVSPEIKFNRIINSMHISYQNRYFIDNECVEDTFETLKAWVLREYPPPKSKSEFKWAIKGMNMYRNEDPCVAYSRWKQKLALINKAIKTINEGLKAEAKFIYPADEDDDKRTTHYNDIKMSPFSWEDQEESLIGMFVHRNNNPRYNNDGNINKLVVKRLCSKKAHQLGNSLAWNKIFSDIKLDLIPPVLVGRREYEYITYPPRDEDDKIYTRSRKPFNPTQQPQKHHQPKNPSSKQNRKKRPRDHFQNVNQPQNKRRKITCARCFKEGHSKDECWAKYDKNRNYIRTPAPKRRTNNIKCGICNRTNHITAQCRLKNVKCFNCGKNGHTAPKCPLKSSKTRNGFTQYPSQQQSSPSVSKEAEVNVMSNAPDAQTTVEMIRQWSQNADMNESTRNDLHQFMNQLTSNHPRK